MNIQYVHKDLYLGEQFTDRAFSKLQKFDKYFGSDAKAKFCIKHEGEAFKLELTVYVKKHIYRSESVSKDLIQALDSSIEHLERQIRKYKTKINKHKKAYSYLDAYFESLKDYNRTDSEDNKQPTGEIVRNKKIDIDLMSPDEAVLQMELLSHNFLLFKHSETGKIALVYKRKDTNYGLIEVND